MCLVFKVCHMLSKLLFIRSLYCCFCVCVIQKMLTFFHVKNVLHTVEMCRIVQKLAESPHCLYIYFNSLNTSHFLKETISLWLKIISFFAIFLTLAKNSERWFSLSRFLWEVTNGSLWCLGTVVSPRTGAILFCCCGMAVDCFLVFSQKNVSNLPDLFLSVTTSYSQSVFTAT